MAKYLDQAGLTTVWTEIKKRLDGVAASGEGDDAISAFTGKGSQLAYADKKIVLMDAADNVLGEVDATPFIKDGMLDDVEIVAAGADGVGSILYNGVTYDDGEKFIKFSWNTDAGTSKVDYLKVDEIGKTYVESDSIAIGDDNKLSVKEVDFEKTKLTSSIQVAGGPLADDTSNDWPTDWKDSAGNKIIPDNLTMKQILEGLFLKVVNGTVTWGSVTWSPSLAAPKVELSSAGPVEVGSTVTFTASAGAATAGTRIATCTCSQGYFEADAEGNVTGSHKTGNKTVSVAASVSGTATLAYTWNNVACASGDSLTVVEGTNTIKASQSGQTATCEALPTTKVFAATNTKAALENVSATLSDTKPSDEALTSENTDTIKAYYPIYTNGKQGSANVQSSETALVADDATKLPLVADNTVFYVLFAPMIDGGTGYRLLVKSGKTITQAMALNTLNGKYEVDMKSSFVKGDTVKKLSGGVEIDYDVYEAKGSAGANALQIKID